MSTPQTPPSTTPSTTPPTTPPVKSSEEYFNSSRLKVIGLITAATVAVGALGGIAGVAFDPDPVPKDNVIQPGGDGGTQLAPQSLGGPGNSAPRGHSAGFGALCALTVSVRCGAFCTAESWMAIRRPPGPARARPTASCSAP